MTTDDAVTIHQGVSLYVAFLSQRQTIDFPLKNGRLGWLQFIKGEIILNNQILSVGDGAAIQNEKANIRCTKGAELLFFDLGANE